MLEYLRIRLMNVNFMNEFGAKLPLLPALLAFSSVLPAQDRTEKQRADLELLQQILVPSSPMPVKGGRNRINAYDNTWEQWVRRTGELPPDFDAMPSVPHLPDPLVISEGGRAVPVTTKVQWEQQRRWIRSQYEHWITGRIPPAPDNLRVASSREQRDGHITIRDVLLEFGPGHRAKLHLQLMIPDGKGPFPVFLTNHARDRSPWVHTAVSRGYVACFYRAQDAAYSHPIPDDSDAYIEIYPEYDFTTLARHAWAAARAVDYLYTCTEVIKTQIGIAGHSRNGKQALLAAAFDERIGAVVEVSGLTGGALPYRYTTDPFAVESIELITSAEPGWFHPRLRFFAGRENKLPVDQNMLMALVAPRGLMLYAGYLEDDSNAFASEQAYLDVRRVYRFLGREKNVWLHLRADNHNMFVADVENFMDFFDTVFGRRHLPKSETLIHGFDFENWKTISGQRVDVMQFPAKAPGDFLKDAAGTTIANPDTWEKRKEEIRARIHWALGEAPPALRARLRPDDFPSRIQSSSALAAAIKENSSPVRNQLELGFGRPRGSSEAMTALGIGVSSLVYGPGLAADLFYPVFGSKRRGGKRPVVIWLHHYAYDRGWSANAPLRSAMSDYNLDRRPGLDALVRRGFVVVAFDQIGFGSRALDGRPFYDRYPQWSLMGKMVADTQAVVDAVAALEDVDASKIYLLGYSLGAKVGLLTAALDGRVKGVVAISGLFPFRLDTPEKGTQGIRHYSHLHGLIPKLGFFLGHEDRVPFDYDEVLALAAPKQVLIVAPELDWFAPVADVRREVEESRRVYRLLGQENSLELWTPRDFNRFPRKLQEKVFDYLAKAAL